jgi:hypothetical protein
VTPPAPPAQPNAIVLPTGSGSGQDSAGNDAGSSAQPELPKPPEIAQTPQPQPPDDNALGDPGTPPVVGSGPCTMTVATTPAGSIVRVDDQPIGPSPVTIKGACKRTKIDVKHPRYAPAIKWVTPIADKPLSVEVPLSRPTHAITVVTVPAGATISIAGNRAGTSPTSVKLMGFTTITLTIEKKGYKTVVEKVYSKLDGERRTIKLQRGK